jgi:hypothetical protein
VALWGPGSDRHPEDAAPDRFVRVVLVLYPAAVTMSRVGCAKCHAQAITIEQALAGLMDRRRGRAPRSVIRGATPEGQSHVPSTRSVYLV